MWNIIHVSTFDNIQKKYSKTCRNIYPKRIFYNYLGKLLMHIL